MDCTVKQKWVTAAAAGVIEKTVLTLPPDRYTVGVNARWNASEIVMRSPGKVLPEFNPHRTHCRIN
ncbi:hypothetical protein [Buttiauxella gaviniae]|jgi:hypothetical protein|uniref:hypothetical protein n=1 Tax=Buttiauxella gaviniae TaxID=82990 RepID=UPI003C7167B2